jgi:type IV pilus assembly protein PilA
MSPQKIQSDSISVYAYECFLTLIYIGVICALARPSIPNEANQEQPSEAKQYVSLMNRGQQSYFAEKNALATSMAALETSLKTETINYKYSVRTTKQAAFNYGVSKHPKNKSYVGGVFLVPVKEIDLNAPKDAMITSSILCEADSPGTIEPAAPTYQNGKVICGKGTTEVTK